MSPKKATEDQVGDTKIGSSDSFASEISGDLVKKINEKKEGPEVMAVNEIPKEYGSESEPKEPGLARAEYEEARNRYEQKKKENDEFLRELRNKHGIKTESLGQSSDEEKYLEQIMEEKKERMKKLKAPEKEGERDSLDKPEKAENPEKTAGVNEKKENPGSQENFLTIFDNHFKNIFEMTEQLKNMPGFDQKLRYAPMDDIRIKIAAIGEGIARRTARKVPKDEIISLSEMKKTTEDFLSLRLKLAEAVSEIYSNMFKACFEENKEITGLNDLREINAEEFLKKNSNGKLQEIIAAIVNSKEADKKLVDARTGEDMHSWIRRIFAKILETKGIDSEIIFGQKL